jgi:hypothetical protein
LEGGDCRLGKAAQLNSFGGTIDMSSKETIVHWVEQLPDDFGIQQILSAKKYGIARNKVSREVWFYWF